MELCSGDITKKQWVTWHVTWPEAIAWCRYNIKRRFEWLEIINSAFGDTADGKEKKCRNSITCSLCRKNCRQRVVEMH